MSERESKKFSGFNEEEAVARACAELGLTRSELEYEVVQEGGRKLLGLINKEFVIKARPKAGVNKKGEASPVLSKNEYGFSVEGDSNYGRQPQQQNQNQHKGERKERSENTGRQGNKGARATNGERQNNRRQGSEGQRQRQQQDRQQQGGRHERHERTREEGQTEGRNQGQGYRENNRSNRQGRQNEQRNNDPRRGRRDNRRGGEGRREGGGYRERAPKVALLPPEEEAALIEKKIARGSEFLIQIFKFLKIDVSVAGVSREGVITFNLTAENIEAATEHEERLFSELQILLDKAINCEDGEPHRPARVAVEIPLSERDMKLKAKVEETAKRAIELGKPITLGPMRAADRKVAHLAVRDIQGVRTESKGMEPNRRLMIIPLRKQDEAARGQSPSEERREGEENPAPIKAEENAPEKEKESGE